MPAPGVSPYECSAALRVGGFALDVGEVSNLIGSRSTKTLKNRRNLDIWILDSPLERNRPIDSHLVWFTNAAFWSARTFETVRRLKGVEFVDIFVAISPGSAVWHAFLRPDLLRKLWESAMNLDMSFVFLDSASSLEASSDRPPEIPARWTTRAFASLSGEFPQRSFSSLDEALRALALRISGSPNTLRNNSQSGSDFIESRLETDLEWPSVRISHHAFQPALMMDAPLSVRVELI